MNTQPIDPDFDMDTIHSWWEAHEQPVDLADVLSDRGLIVPGVCAAWLYLSDGPMAWIGWPVANPHATPKEVHDGLTLVFKELMQEAAESGAKLVMAVTSVSGLVKTFKRVGFTEGSVDATSLFAGV